MFPIGHSMIQLYSQDYLLEPMELNTKLKLDPVTNEVKVSLVVLKLEIQMHKKQFKNIIKLVELDHEYNAILSE